MKNPHHRRLIEISLPLKAVSNQSAREKSIRHGHVSTLHVWWARRPLAAMRAATFASLVPAPESDEDRERLEDLIATIVDWDQVKDGNQISESANQRTTHCRLGIVLTCCGSPRCQHLTSTQSRTTLCALQTQRLAPGVRIGHRQRQ